ncbi:MAG: nucleotide exchange factor GrpE [Eubacteriales bacterium]
MEEVDYVEEKVDDEVMEILLNTREQGQMIERLIQNQIEVKDKMIDKLHEELNYYKQDTADRFVEQLMKALIKVRKDMKKRMTSNQWDTMSVGDVKREFEYLLEDITDLLELQNVDVYSTKPGEMFDGSIHQPKIEVTSEEALNRTIKESGMEGYRRGNKILIPEQVVVYQYKGEKGEKA